uniref:Deneddylase BPLF1 n=1 Tax=Anthurium amnicola TaxID=1678845 RepID=A0A1D1YYJ4_9ARAE
MVRPGSEAKVVHDTSHAYAARSGFKLSSSEWHNFMSPNIADMYRRVLSSGPANKSDSEDEEMDVRNILKEIKYLGSSNMSWKERKEMENRKVVALGGKPPKKQRLPLSVAKVPMKRHKLQEQKKLQEDMYLSQFQKKRTKERLEKRKPEDDILMASEGYFKKGVLNVKHLFGSSRPKNDVHMSVGNRKKGKEKKKGKKKRH